MKILCSILLIVSTLIVTSCGKKGELEAPSFHSHVAGR